MSVPDPSVKLQTEPGFASELIHRLVEELSLEVFVKEALRVVQALEEYRQGCFRFNAIWLVDEVDQMQPLVHAAGLEEGSVYRQFLDDKYHDRSN